jgi:hypothetical protein
MQKRKLAVWLIAIAIILIFSMYFDKEIVKQISYLRFDLLSEILLGITFVSSEIVIFFFLTSLFLWNENKRRWILPLWITLFFSVIISFFLKITIQRLRPFQLGYVSIYPFNGIS